MINQWFEILGGRRYEDDTRKSTDDDYNRRDRDRYNNNPSRRDHGSGRYNHHDRGKCSNNFQKEKKMIQLISIDNYRPPRDRDSNESNNHRRPSNDSFTSEPQSKIQPK